MVVLALPKGFFMAKNTTKKLVEAGIIAALYAILSLIAFPVASGGVQLRLSEGLTLLPLFLPHAIWGLAMGCLLANLITGCLFLDILLGSLVTLIAGILTFLCAKLIKSECLKTLVGGLFPVALNALLLPLVWVVCYGALEYIYLVQFALLFLSQSICVYGFGLPCIMAYKRFIKNRLY